MSNGATTANAIAAALQQLNTKIDAQGQAILQTYWSAIANALLANTVTNWTSYTPTLGSGWTSGTVTPTGKWRRVGDSIEVRVHIALTGAPVGSLTTVSLPADPVLGALTIDTAKLLSPVASRGNLGYGNIISGGGAVGSSAMDILYSSTTAVRPAFYTTGSAVGVALNDSGISATAPGVFASGDSVDFFFQVPITQYA